MSLPEIVVCMKVVPRPEEVRIDPETLTLDRTHVRSLINPADLHALEMALAVKDRYGGCVRLLSMGPPLFIEYLRVALAVGADEAYLLSDRAFGGADTLATSYTLAAGIRRLGAFDLVVCGEESSDGATAQVPAGIAEWLDVPQVTYASDIALVEGRSQLWARRSLAGGEETLITTLPAVLSVSAHANEPRFIDMERRAWAQDAPVTVWSIDDLDVDPDWIGAGGSPTAVAGTHEAPMRERRRERLTGTPEEQARELVKRLGSQFKAAAVRSLAGRSATQAPVAPAGTRRTTPPTPSSAASRHLTRSERATTSASDVEWFGRAALVASDQSVVAQLLAELWKRPVKDGVEHWGGVVRTECGGHLPFTGEYTLRLENGAEGKVVERSSVRAYAQRGLAGEEVELRGIGPSPF